MAHQLRWAGEHQMYGALWRSIPGPGWWRFIVMVVLFSAVVATLFLYVFPQVAPLMPFNDNTVGS